MECCTKGMEEPRGKMFIFAFNLGMVHIETSRWIVNWQLRVVNPSRYPQVCSYLFMGLLSSLA